MTEATPQRPPPFMIRSSRSKQRYLKMLVYGGFGAGKTTLLGTSTGVSEMSDVIMIDAEAGDMSLDDFDCDVVQATNYKMVARVQEFLKQHCAARDKGDLETLRKMEAKLKGVPLEEVTEPRQYRTVILDSLSEVEAYCMYQLLGVNDSTKIDEEVQTAEWSEYKRNHQMIQRLVRAFRDLPMNVLITCAAQYNQDETKKFRYSPLLTGKLSNQVQGFMDLVGYLVVGDAGEDGVQPRRLYVQPSGSGRYDAKNRFSRYRKSYFDNPTIPGILDACGLQLTTGSE